MSKEFNIACFCLNHTDIILLEFLLSVIEKTTDTQWKLTSGILGDIAIFNTDELEGIEHYEKAINGLSPPICITYSSKPISADKQLHLNKPLRSSDFIVLINRILDENSDLGKEIQDKSPRASNMIINDNKKNPSHSKTLKKNYNVKRTSFVYLYNVLSENKESNSSPIKVTFQNINIYIDFKYNQYISNHHLSDLIEVIKTDINLLDISNISNTEISKLKERIKSSPLSELIWYSTLMGSNGYLNKDINEQTLLHLNRWPNFKTLIHLPRHITLAAFMTKNTCTLEDVSKQTLIPLDDIISFVNANKAMGYLDIDINQNQSTVICIKKDTQEKKLFSKLYNKLLSAIKN